MSTVDDYEEEYDYDEEEGGVSGLVILLVIAVILAAFALIVWSAYNKGLSQSASAGGNIPVVAANPTPASTELEVASIGSENSEVYDIIEGNVPSDVIVDAGSNNDPLEGYETTRDVGLTLAERAKLSLEKEAANDRKNAEELVAEEQAQRQADATAKRLAAEKAAADKAAREKEAAEQRLAEMAAKKAAAEKAAREAAAVAAPTVLAPTIATGDALSGSHVVQVAAFRSNDEATGYFASLGRKHGSFITAKSIDIQRADLGAKGVYYRLRIGPFANKAAAVEYCETLKTKGQDCLIKGL